MRHALPTYTGLWVVVVGCSAASTQTPGPRRSGFSEMAEAVAPAPTAPGGSECGPLRWTVRSFPGVAVRALRATAEGAVWLQVGERSLLVSTNRGEDFAPIEVNIEPLFDSEYLDGIDEPRIRNLWARGTDIYVTTQYQLFVGSDGGRHWKRLAAPKMDMGGVMRPSPVEDVWANTATLYYLESRGVLHASVDNGLTWQEDEHIRALYQGAFLRIRGNDAGFRYVADGYSRLLGTADDGATWSVLEPAPPLSEIWFVAAGPKSTALGVAIDESGEASAWYETQDGGRTWQEQTGLNPSWSVATAILDDWYPFSPTEFFRPSKDGKSWEKETVEAARGDAWAEKAAADQSWNWSNVWRFECVGYAFGRPRDADTEPQTWVSYFARGVPE